MRNDYNPRNIKQFSGTTFVTHGDVEYTIDKRGWCSTSDGKIVEVPVLMISGLYFHRVDKPKAYGPDGKMWIENQIWKYGYDPRAQINHSFLALIYAEDRKPTLRSLSRVFSKDGILGRSRGSINEPTFWELVDMQEMHI